MDWEANHNGFDLFLFLSISSPPKTTKHGILTDNHKCSETSFANENIKFVSKILMLKHTTARTRSYAHMEIL